MATLTRLASTLTARYFPSGTLTDAFYLDGRLCGKRETRQADITIDKDERGFFFSLFTHPTIEGFEPGTIPPFEPQLRGLCNEVKTAHKEIDAMIEKFLSTAVEVAGTTKLTDNETRDPYFTGVIVRDSEAFAVIIGGGLAFLYRDDTMFPLTDAGIPMEPIDAYGNRVGDFQYYCSSKTANALWSNFFTLTPDDCIILCNKAIYDALGQREILRILTDAEDQCDAAGLILTQASARMPNTPMQISISFVESVTKEEKRGLFGKKKKNKDYDSASHELLESTVEGGEVGAAAKAIADAGFVSLTPEATVAPVAAAAASAAAPADGSVQFGDMAGQPEAQKVPEAAPEFPDKTATPEELSAEEAMKKIFGEMQKSAQSDSEAVSQAEAAAAQDSPFVFNIDNVATSQEVATAAPAAPVMETVSKTEFTPDMSDDSPTKPVTDINSLLFTSSNGVLAQAIAESKEKETVAKETTISDLTEEPVVPVIPTAPVAPVAPIAPVAPVAAAPAAGAVTFAGTAVAGAAAVPPAPAVVNKPEEIVFAPGEVKADAGQSDVTANAEDTFDPYGKTSAQELKNAAPIVFGDDGLAPKEEPVASEAVSSIPVPEYELTENKPELKDEDKLGIDFPETDKPQEVIAEPAPQAVITEQPAQAPAEDDIVLPFGDPAYVSGMEEPVAKADDIPQMPLYDSDNYNNPVNAVGSEENISQPYENASFYGDYAGAEAQAEAGQQVPPYQPYGAEAFSAVDQSSFGTYGTQNENMQGGAPMDSNGYPDFGNGENGYVPGYDQAPSGGYEQYPNGGYQDPNAAASPFYQQEGGYTDFGAQAQEAYGEDYAQPQASASSSASLDDEWFNNILGVDDAGQAYGGEQGYGYEPAGEAQPVVPDAQQQAQYTNPGQTSYRPSGSGPNNNGRPTGSAPRTSASSGAGGGGGKKMKLNRNGYMFIAFLAILLICIIIVVALIARGCSKKPEPTETSVTEASESITTAPTAPSTQATLADPSAPIGYFVFSDFTGFRTWWDVFHYVYGIDIENNSDPRIAIIITYNKLDPTTYTGPNSGDSLLLPPVEVINGTIENTWSGGTDAGAATGADGAGETQPGETTSDEITSSIHIT